MGRVSSAKRCKFGCHGLLCCVWSLRVSPDTWAVAHLTGCLFRQGLQKTQCYGRCSSSTHVKRIGKSQYFGGEEEEMAEVPPTWWCPSARPPAGNAAVGETGSGKSQPGRGLAGVRGLSHFSVPPAASRGGTQPSHRRVQL